MRFVITILCTILFSVLSHAQGIDTTVQAQQKQLTQSIENISSKSLASLNDQYTKLTTTIESQSEKVLKRIQDKEAKLQKKLQAIDSTKAKELFSNTESKYQDLQEKLKSPVYETIAQPLKEYIPGLDSTNTALKFLMQPNSLSGFSTVTIKQLSSVTASVQDLQGRLQQANEIQSFISERETELKETLTNTGLGKELLSINKEVYYYQARIKEYKDLLNNKKKTEEKLLAEIRKLPAFQSFMQKNSYLALLFPQPQNYDPVAAINGLQTRSGIEELISQRLGSATTGGNPQQYLQQQVQAAQAEINKLKDKVNKLGGGSGSSDMTMPDFKPDKQKTKSFFQRLEYGINIQSTKSTYLLPVTSDLAATLGYKLNDKATVGFGLSYKIGWGTGWNNIKFSSQGVGLRSYADIKAKGNLWITGGFEYNYMQAFAKLEEIKNIDVWQHSALAGLTKKIKLGKKRESKVQLLYDFLATKQIPQSAPLKFRIGWSF